MKNSLEWGEDNTGKTQSRTLNCPDDECKCKREFDQKYDSLKYNAQIALGVRYHPENNPNRPYILSCKCPECFTKFWYHLDINRAELILHYRQKAKQRKEK